MGTADLVPGVSGGTIAFLFGIYNELLEAIKTLTGTTLKLLFKGRFKEAWRSIPLRFLVPLFIGILTAIFALASLISYLLEEQGLFVWSFFFGLVIGSALVIRKRIKRWTWQTWASLIIGTVVTFFVVGLTSGSIGSGPLAVLLSGMIAFCAMILPGISGSLMLVVLGQYQYILDSVSERVFTPLILLALGGAVGLGLFSRLLSWLLKHYHAIVIAFLIGMLLGSLRKIWPWRNTYSAESTAMQMNQMPAFDWTFPVCLLLAALAVFLVTRLEALGLTEEQHHDVKPANPTKR